MPASACPDCGYAVDAASAVGHKTKPAPGDISVCMSCTAILTFDADLHLCRIADPDLARKVAADPYVRGIRREILEMLARNPRPV